MAILVVLYKHAHIIAIGLNCMRQWVWYIIRLEVDEARIGIGMRMSALERKNMQT